MPDDEDVLKNVKFQEGKLFGEWKVGKKIDEGGFGMVYLVTSTKDKKIAALKAESNEVEGGSAIKLESMILKRLNAKGPIPHVPEMYLVAKRKRYCYMVLTLLGPNLRSLMRSHGKRKGGFSVGTWSRLGIQCLYGLKFVHDNGFVHRDVKPQNFLLGAPEDKERARIVHVLDFGLARPFAQFNPREKKWEARRARRTAEFRGTLRYTSPNVHTEREQGRGDDVWSLLYVLIEFNGEPYLPWTYLKDPKEMVDRKLAMSPSKVMKYMPESLLPVMRALEKLNYYQRPDYHLFFEALWKVMKNENVTPQSKYDWEEVEPSKNIPAAKWEDPTGAFFSSDPIGINDKPGKNVLPMSEAKTSIKSSRVDPPKSTPKDNK